MNPWSPHPLGTFRDPQGRVYRHGDRILREIYPESVASVLVWLRSPLLQRWINQRRIVPSQILVSEPGETTLIEHERLWFPTYPWEWTPGQWVDAASLTLDLCEEAVDNGMILKDATPLNILFSGSRPIFVDVLSFEGRDLQSPLWISYAQFVRTFLLPLCAYVHLGWPLAATLQRRDGYEPADLAPFLPFLRRWRHPLRSLVTLPMLLDNKGNLAARRPQVSEEMSGFSVHHLIRSTRKLLQSLTPLARSSRWSGYTRTATHYKSSDHEAKQAVVRSWLFRERPTRVLDVGANSGVYSRVAAASGADVVAWDTDVQASDLNWQAARSADLSILPLVADFARPTPAMGWQNRESASLLDRSRKAFDCVMMLGIMHHLLVVDQIPLVAIFEQLWEITTRWAIVEWIPIEDPQFDELCRGRQELSKHLKQEYFTQILSMRFLVRDQATLPNGRSLWLLEAIA